MIAKLIPADPQTEPATTTTFGPFSNWGGADYIEFAACFPTWAGKGWYSGLELWTDDEELVWSITFPEPYIKTASDSMGVSLESLPNREVWFD